MALTRRELLAVLPLVAASGACSELSRPSATRQVYREVFSTPGPGSQPVILVCMPETTQTKEVWTGLSDELKSEFRLVAIKVESADAAAVIAEGIARHRPAALVLMNNPTVEAYRRYQRAHPQQRYAPAVVVMTSFLDRDKQLRSATGISYEVPLVTVVTNLRRVLATPLERVGVVLRAPLRGFVRRQAALAAHDLLAEPSPSELKRALRRLKTRADVVWVLNDDRLLTPRLIADAWLPELNERPWSPAIVGVGALVSPEQSFGTFAVLPDHTALGAQAASMVFDIASEGWRVPDDAEVELPLSTTTTMDLVQVRERFALQQHALEQVDRILE